MKLFCDKTFSTNTWSQNNGSGSVSSIGGGVMFVGIGCERFTSYLIRPGETIKFRVKAKTTQAAGGFIRFDVETKGTLYDNINIPVSVDIDVYEMTYTCPASMSAGVCVIISLGNSSSAKSNTITRFIDPDVEILNSCVSVAPLRSIAFALVNVSKSVSGGAIINQGFINFGISEIQVNSSYVRIILDHSYTDYANSIQNKRPLPFLTPTHEGGSMVYCCGSVGVVDTNSDKRLKLDVYFYDSASKAAINPTTITNCYFTIEVRSI